MVQTSEQVLAGTASEIAGFLQYADLGNRQLTLIVPLEDESDLLPDPPTTIRGKAHLDALLSEGLASGESTLMTNQNWNDIRQEVRARHAQRQACECSTR